jgi:hypothetical protein
MGKPSLLGGHRERRQLADVANVVLDDDGRFEICDGLLHALDRGDDRGAVEVEVSHAATLVVLAEVDQVAGEQPVTLAPCIGVGAVIPSQSPLPMSSVAFVNGAIWPVWSP